MPNTRSTEIYQQYNKDPDSPRNKLEALATASLEIYEAYSQLLTALTESLAQPNSWSAEYTNLMVAHRNATVPHDTIRYIIEVQSWLKATRRGYERTQRYLYRKERGQTVNKPYQPRRNPTKPRQSKFATSNYEHLREIAAEQASAGLPPINDIFGPPTLDFDAPVTRILDGAPPPEPEFDPSQPLDLSHLPGSTPKLSLDDLAAIERATKEYDKEHDS